MGYSKAPEQPQSRARPIYHSHSMTSTGREPATIHFAAYRSSMHCATGDDMIRYTLLSDRVHRKQFVTYTIHVYFIIISKDLILGYVSLVNKCTDTR